MERTYEQKFTDYTDNGIKVNVYYNVEGDVDGNTYFIDKLVDMFGNTVEYNKADDFEQRACEHYQQMAHDAYMKYGDCI
jgi:hypothetical protein